MAPQDTLSYGTNLNLSINSITFTSNPDFNFNTINYVAINNIEFNYVGDQVSLDSGILISLSRALSQAELGSLNIMLEQGNDENNSTIIQFTQTYDEDTQQLRLQPESLNFQQHYHLSVNSPAFDPETTLQTEFQTLDFINIASTTPAINSENVAVDSNLSIELSRTMSQAEFSHLNLHLIETDIIRDSKIESVVRLNQEQHQLVIEPNSNLSYGKNYQIQLSSDAMNPTTNHSINFSTIAPVEILNTDPISLNRFVETNKAITISLSRNFTDTELSDLQVLFEGIPGDSGGPQTLGFTLEQNIEQQQLVIKPNNEFDYQTWHRLAIASEALLNNGESVAHFQTTPAGGVLPIDQLEMVKVIDVVHTSPPEAYYTNKHQHFLGHHSTNGQLSTAEVLFETNGIWELEYKQSFNRVIPGEKTEIEAVEANGSSTIGNIFYHLGQITRINFAYSDATSNWHFEYDCQFTYELDILLNELICLSRTLPTDPWVLDSFVSYTYDSDGFMISSQREHYNNGMLDETIVETRSYNNGNLISTIEASTGISNQQYKTDYTYIDGLRMNEMRYVFNETTINWELIDKVLYTYLNGNRIKEELAYCGFTSLNCEINYYEEYFFDAQNYMTHSMYYSFDTTQGSFQRQRESNFSDCPMKKTYDNAKSRHELGSFKMISLCEENYGLPSLFDQMLLVVKVMSPMAGGGPTQA